MMGEVTSLAARELSADKVRAAEQARSSRVPTSSVVGIAAMRRQRSRVLQSLVLVPRRRESSAAEPE